MADAPTLEDVGHILTYVAPGFFARSAYAVKFPQRTRDSFDLLIVTVATSVPLVAMTNALARRLDVALNPTDLAYVLLLLAVAITAGYLTGVIRGWSRCRDILRKVGYQEEPETMLAARTLLRLPTKRSMATVTLKDGRIISGTPEYSTSDPNASLREMYLTFPAWYDSESRAWQDRADHGGVILNMDDVLIIQTDEDPT